MKQANLLRLASFALVFFLIISAVKGQEIVSEGDIPDLHYFFSGYTQYKLNPDLVHALSYANNTDVKDINATKTYHVSYTVKRKLDNSFETTLNFHYPKENGHLSFYKFYKPNWILPKLKSIKLVVKDDDDFIYIKTFDEIVENQKELSFSFNHQRFSDDWEFAIIDVEWDKPISVDDFNKRWEWMNDYQSAMFLLDEQAICMQPKGNPYALLYKKRWLTIYNELESLDFYQKFIKEEGNDPLGLERTLRIRKLILSREITSLKDDFTSVEVSIDTLAMAMMQADECFYHIAQKDIGLYTDLYLKMEDDSYESYCFSEVDWILGNDSISVESLEGFQNLYKDKSIQNISSLLEEKQANWALFQIKRLETFIEYAKHINNSNNFHQYKSKAVYDIYLSYISVARQAINMNKMDMAGVYLSKASEIQARYPSEIINDKYVDKELEALLINALERYNKMVEAGDMENAEKIKRGILGLIKKYQLDFDKSLLKQS